jgi:hypothetical protein
MHIIKVKKIFLTLLVPAIFSFCFSFPVRAATQKVELNEIAKFIKKKRVNAAYAIGGGNTLDVSKLNLSLSERGFPEVPANYLSYGVGGHFINNKLVFGVELINLLERTTTAPTDYNLSVSVKFILLNFGHLIYQKKGLMFYPYMGAGYGRFKMLTAQNNIDSFNDISLMQKNSESVFSNMIFNLGFAGDYFLNYNSQKKGLNNVIIGFRIGINFIPFNSTWKINRIPVPDGPQTGINGPYFRIVIGLGGWAERIIRKAIR